MCALANMTNDKRWMAHTACGFKFIRKIAQQHPRCVIYLWKMFFSLHSLPPLALALSLFIHIHFVPLPILRASIPIENIKDYNFHMEFMHKHMYAYTLRRLACTHARTQNRGERRENCNLFSWEKEIHHTCVAWATETYMRAYICQKFNRGRFRSSWLAVGREAERRKCSSVLDRRPWCIVHA